MAVEAERWTFAAVAAFVVIADERRLPLMHRVVSDPWRVATGRWTAAVADRRLAAGRGPSLKL